jgi:hypothetical protein
MVQELPPVQRFVPAPAATMPSAVPSRRSRFASVSRLRNSLLISRVFFIATSDFNVEANAVGLK